MRTQPSVDVTAKGTKISKPGPLSRTSASVWRLLCATGKGCAFFAPLNAGINDLPHTCGLGGLNDIAVLLNAGVEGVHSRHEQQGIDSV